MDSNAPQTVGEYVANDFRTAAVFTKFNIDFCCKGNIAVDEVCEKKGINKNQLFLELEKVTFSEIEEAINYKAWPTDLLIQYILKIHHTYVRQKIPVLQQYLEKLCKVHGVKHPELFEINDLFGISAAELEVHLRKEEDILFPHIEKMMQAIEHNLTIEQPYFGSVDNPLAVLHNDHDTEGRLFERIASLTNNYTPPEDACQTYRVTFEMLKDFEVDLHKHIHLENNIVFIRAKELENCFSLV